jgi:hypothetical protein
LTLSNAAIEKLPHPYLFETRGQVLCKMERYQECILDLEKGLQAPELASAIYPSLITAYQKLGNQSLADEYAMRLEEIKSKNPDPASTPSEKANIPAIAPASDTDPSAAEGK